MGRNAKPASEENQRLIAYTKRYNRQLARVQKRNEKYVRLIDAAAKDKRFVPMCDILPEEERGRAKIEHFTVDPTCSHVSRLRALLNPDTRWHEYIPSGRYARLLIDGTLFMTDTGHERFSSLPLLDNAKGNVLVTGLGLGMVLTPLLENPKVKKIVVVENNGDVVHAVLPALVKFWQNRYSLRVRDVAVSLNDAWTWDPYKETIQRGQKFDTIFHDIWATLGPELLPEFAKLKRRYRKWLKKGGWQGCWAEETCRQLRREDIRKFREMQAAVGGDPMRKLPPLKGVWKP